MIQNKSSINFLTTVFSESIPDVANILNAQAEDEYDTIITYFKAIADKCEDWIETLKKERDDKKRNS